MEDLVTLLNSSHISWWRTDLKFYSFKLQVSWVNRKCCTTHKIFRKILNMDSAWPPPLQELPVGRTSGHVEGSRVDQQLTAWEQKGKHDLLSYTAFKDRQRDASATYLSCCRAVRALRTSYHSRSLRLLYRTLWDRESENRSTWCSSSCRDTKLRSQETTLTGFKHWQIVAWAQCLRLLEADFPGNVDVKEVNLEERERRRCWFNDNKIWN